MPRNTVTSLSTVIVTGIAALLLAGCGSPASNEPASSGAGAQSDTTTASDENEAGASTASDEDEAGASSAQGEAVLSYGDTSYSAQLEFCSLSGTEDALFHGMAYDDAGEQVGYLNGDFGALTDLPHGEARIDFGATAKLQSTDEFVAMGTVAGHIVVADFSDTDLIVVGGAWDQAGTQLPTATLKVTC
ncbi:hypothetical protein [Microbacterium sp. A94]|uniref:hypothetical protein n=1 Tax=Microbacterium sp. A94 TaxID=3450717 RepID=UPI003F42A75E